MPVRSLRPKQGDEPVHFAPKRKHSDTDPAHLPFGGSPGRRNFQSATFLAFLRKAGEWNLVDEELQVYPWGFRDAECEQKYQTFFSATYTNNHRRGMLVTVSTTLVGHLASMLGYWQAEPFERAGFISSLFRALLTGFVVYNLCHTHISAFFKVCVSYMIPWVFWVIPLAHALEASSSTSSQSKLLFEMTQISFALPYGHPNWRFSTSMVIVVVCWLPTLMQLSFHGRDASWLWVPLALIDSTVGPVWGAWLAVTRRRAYMLSHPAWAWVKGSREAAAREVHPPVGSSSNLERHKARRTKRAAQALTAERTGRPRRSSSLFSLGECDLDWRAEEEAAGEPGAPAPARTRRRRRKAASCDARVAQHGGAHPSQHGHASPLTSASSCFSDARMPSSEGSWISSAEVSGRATPSSSGLGSCEQADLGTPGDRDSTTSGCSCQRSREGSCEGARRGRRKHGGARSSADQQGQGGQEAGKEAHTRTCTREQAEPERERQTDSQADIDPGERAFQDFMRALQEGTGDLLLGTDDV